MNKFLFLVLLFLSVFILPAKVEAQFLKGLFKSRQKHAKNAPAPAKPVEKKKQEIVFGETVKKACYRIDILAQLYLNELVNDDKLMYKDRMPDKASAGIEFSEGAMIAADSLNSMGYDVDIYIHDVMNKTEFPTALIGNKQLDTTSLIIGAVNGKDIQELAVFANSHHINFVSALSPSDADVTKNIYFTLLQPNLQKHCEFLKNELVKKYPDRHISFFYRTNFSVDDNAFHYLQMKDSTWTMKKILCNTMPPKATLDSLFDSTVTNVILMGIVEPGLAEKMLTMLNKDFAGYKFEVYGMPSWKAMQAIHKADAFANIGINLSAPFYFNQNSPVGKYVDRKFKRQFSGNPGEMVFRGFETTFWFASLLLKYGTVFNAHYADNDNTPFTKFLILPQWDKNFDLLYNENENLLLYRYQGGSYMVTQP